MPALNSRRHVGHVLPRHFLAIETPKETLQEEERPKIIVRAWSPETGYVVREVEK